MPRHTYKFGSMYIYKTRSSCGNDQMFSRSRRLSTEAPNMTLRINKLTLLVVVVLVCSCRATSIKLDEQLKNDKSKYGTRDVQRHCSINVTNKQHYVIIIIILFSLIIKHNIYLYVRSSTSCQLFEFSEE